MRDEDRLRTFFDPGGQQQREGGALAGNALDRNLAAVIAHDAVADAETKAGAFADIAGREERVENAGQIGGLDAVPGVGDEQFDRRRGLVVARSYPQPFWRAAAHRLLGIEQQIQQRLLDLAAVRHDRRQRRIKLRHELHVVQPVFVGAQRQDAPEQVGDVLWRARRGLTAGEREQVAHDPCGTLRLVGDPPEIVRQFGARPNRALMLRVEQLFLQQLRVADYARERVVQFVRDAGNQLADGGKLLRLEQLRLGGLEPLERRHRPRVRQCELVAHQLHPARTPDVLGDVLRHLHDRGAVAAAGNRERRDAENLPVRTRDLGAAAPGRKCMRHGAVTFRILTEADFGAGRAVQAAHVAGKVGGQRRVAAEQDSVAVEHSDRIADRVERPLPLALPSPHHVVQPRVLNRDHDLAGHSRDEALIRELEPVRRRGAE